MASPVVTEQEHLELVEVVEHGVVVCRYAEADPLGDGDGLELTSLLVIEDGEDQNA